MISTAVQLRAWYVWGVAYLWAIHDGTTLSHDEGFVVGEKLLIA